MSYKFIFQNTRYINLSSAKMFSKNYLYNELLENKYIIHESQYGCQNYNRFLHTTLFIRCLNSTKELKSVSVNQNNVGNLKTKSTDESTKTVDTVEITPIQAPSSKEKAIVKKSLWTRVKDEIIHYYHGFRLLFLDIKVAIGILNTITKGHTLTRRERKQLVRTSADIARMLPFLVFIIVPFMELLLPLYLKFFPFMLPSTFQVESKDKEFTLQKLKGKLEIAKFLQEAIAESAAIKKISKQDGIDLTTFSDFLKQARESGLTVNTQDILRFSHLFEDEVTLESLNPKYLKALCKLLDINTIGPPVLLRFQLEMKVRQLKVDDKMISSEGVDKIPIWELQQLCRERGMRSFGVSEARLRYQLSQWLSLHLEKKVPTTLLLLSRVMYLPETLTPEEQLKQAILVLPQTVSNTAKLKVSDTEERVDHKTKFEVIQAEQHVINQERIEANKAIKEAGVTTPVPMPKPSEDKAPIIEITAVDPDKAPVVSQLVKEQTLKTPSTPGAKPVSIVDKSEVTAQDLVHIESAIVQLEDKTTIFHKEELSVLKENRNDITKKLSLPDDITPAATTEVTTAKRLGDKLDKMIDEIEKDVENIDVETNKLQKEELKIDKPIIPKETESAGEKRFIDIEDVLIILRKHDPTTDDVKWKNILFILDENHDGKIEIEHIMKVIKLLRTEDIKLSTGEIRKMLEIIDKEAHLAESKKPQV